MDLATILHQIDTEITKLQQIREIVQGLASQGRHVRSLKPRDPKPIATVPPALNLAPELVILPPKQKREYAPRLKPTLTVSRALGPAPSERPVFVPRASVTSRVEPRPMPAASPSLEAVVRQKLFGGAA